MMAMEHLAGLNAKTLSLREIETPAVAARSKGRLELSAGWRVGLIK